jgi:hypothetical protein
MAAAVREYRRGIKDGVWQQLWHFHPECLNFPTRNFTTQTLKPLDENLCSRCDSLARDGVR